MKPLILLVVTLFGAPALMQAPNPPARITGRVVAAETGLPIRGAVVQLVGGSSPAVSTDLEGRFALAERRIGRYSLLATKPGYVPSVFAGLPPAEDYFELIAGHQFDRGTIRLQVAAVISGRVQSESGEPLADVTVTAWRVEFPQAGIRTWRAVKEASTNDLGEFRLHGLMPGRYQVAASRLPQPPEPVRTPDSSVALVASITGQAGGMPHVSEPVAVETIRGGETSGTTLTLTHTRYVRVSGTAIDSNGQPVSSNFVTLRPAQPDGLPVRRGANVIPNRGSFAFNNVPVGEYRLSAGATPMRAGNVPGLPESVAMPISVREDISGLVLQTEVTQSRLAVTGRVLVDGVPSAARLQLLGPTGDSAVPSEALGLPTGVMMTKPDGSLIFSGGDGWFALRPASSPARGLKSVTMAGVDVTEGFDMKRANGPVEVHLTSQVSTVSGVVRDADGGAAAACDVVIFSVDPTSWKVPFSRRVVLVRANERGAFEVAGLPAGLYLAVAPAGLDRSMWADPDRLERWRTNATPLSIIDGEVTKVELKRN